MVGPQSKKKLYEADGSPFWTKVDPYWTIHTALQVTGYVIPELPVFHAIVRGSVFEPIFLAKCPYP